MLVLSIAGQEMPTFPRMWTNVNIAPDMFLYFLSVKFLFFSLPNGETR